MAHEDTQRGKVVLRQAVLHQVGYPLRPLLVIGNTAGIDKISVQLVRDDALGKGPEVLLEQVAVWCGRADKGVSTDLVRIGPGPMTSPVTLVGIIAKWLAPSLLYTRLCLGISTRNRYPR